MIFICNSDHTLVEGIYKTKWDAKLGKKLAVKETYTHQKTEQHNIMHK